MKTADTFMVFTDGTGFFSLHLFPPAVLSTYHSFSKQSVSPLLLDKGLFLTTHLQFGNIFFSETSSV